MLKRCSVRVLFTFREVLDIGIQQRQLSRQPNSEVPHLRLEVIISYLTSIIFYARLKISV